MATRYWVGTSAANRSGSWTSISTTVWSNSSGGANGAPVPTAVDTVIFPEYSLSYFANLNSGTVTCSNLTITGNNITLTGSTTLVAYGNIAINGTGFIGTAWSGTLALRPNSTLGNSTLYTANQAFRANLEVNCQSGYSVVLNSNVLVSGAGNAVTNLISGNLDLNGYTLTTNGANVSGVPANQRGLNFGNAAGSLVLGGSFIGLVGGNLTNFTTDKLGNVIDTNCGTKTYVWGPTGATTSNWIKLTLSGAAGQTPSVSGWYEVLDSTGVSGFFASGGARIMGSFYGGAGVSQVATGTWGFTQGNGIISLNGGRLGTTTISPGAGNTVTLNGAFLANDFALLTGTLNANSYSIGCNIVTWGNTANSQAGTVISNVSTFTCTTFSAVGNISPLTLSFPLVATTQLSVNGSNTIVQIPSGASIITPSISLTSPTATRSTMNVQGNTTIYNNVNAGLTSVVSMGSNSNINLNGYQLTCGNFSSSALNPRTLNFGDGGRMIVNNSSNAITVINMATMTNFSQTGTNAYGFQTSMSLARTMSLGNAAGAGATANGSINLYIIDGSSALTLGGNVGYFKTLDFGSSTTGLTNTTVHVNSLTLGAANITGMAVNIANYEGIGLTTGTLSSPNNWWTNFLTMNPGANTTITLGTGGFRATPNIQMVSGTLNLNGNELRTGIANYAGGNIIGTGTIDTSTSFYNNGASWTCNATLNSKGSNTANTGFILNSGDITFGTNGGFGPNIGNLITHNGGNLTIDNGIGLTASQNTTYTLNTGNINLNNLYLQVGRFQSFNSNVRNLAFGTSGEIQLTANTNANANANTNQLYVQHDNMTVSGSKIIRLNSQLSNANVTANFYWYSSNGSGPNATTGFYAQADIDKGVNLIVTDQGGGSKSIIGVYDTVDLRYSSVSSVVGSTPNGFACANLLLGSATSYGSMANISMVTGGFITNQYERTMGQLRILHTPNNQTTTLNNTLRVGSVGLTQSQLINVQKGTLNSNGQYIFSVCANVDPVVGVYYDKSIIFSENKPWYLFASSANLVPLYFPNMSNLSITKAANSGFVVAPYYDSEASTVRWPSDRQLIIHSGYAGGANINNAPDLSVVTSSNGNITNANVMFSANSSNGSWFGNLNLSNTTFENLSIAVTNSSAQVINVTNLYLGNTTTYSTQLKLKMQPTPAGGSTTISGNEQTIASLELSAYEPTLTSDLTVAGNVTLSNNALNLSTSNLTANTFSCTGSEVTRILGSGILTITGASFTVNNANFNSGYAGPHTYTINMASGSDKTFTSLGGNFGYGTLIQAGAGNLTIDGSSSFVDIQSNTYPSVISFTNGTTQTLGNFTLSGTDGNLVTINSTTPGSAFTLSKASGTVNAQYLSVKDSIATGGATWNANYSTNAGNNSGWIFGDSPPPVVTYKGNFFVFL